MPLVQAVRTAPIKPTMIVVTAGTYTMSALDFGTQQYEADGKTLRPGTKVTFEKPFQLGRTEVTQAEFASVLGRNPSVHTKAADAGRLPVENVCFYDAIEYCNALSLAEKMTPRYTLEKATRAADGSISFAIVKDAGGAGYRLPTEAEWEYAARAGSTAGWSHGDDEASVGKFAWWKAESSGESKPVATKLPNAWGFHDMAGNVWEWCWNPESKVGGPQPMRGGSWFNCATCCKNTGRCVSEPTSREGTVGFRVARDAVSK
ncbi:MAG: formylglycine-generating enzyme family protein [Planctomycetes bacterium]|nr:formylglycine-generating enzyme family protein [Planctomycetota bacterium]